MDHLGDITKICGYDAPPVDVVIGGSPCQDLSVAGKREGFAGARSGLYMEQIRIIKELRDADKRRGRTGIAVRPRYMVWENVEGALSSPGRDRRGEDFRTALEEAIRIAEPEAPDLFVPEKGWPGAGAVCDEQGGWSLAWRVLDAQHWGTPQRRKRICMVVDFAGATAPGILFPDAPDGGCSWGADADQTVGHPGAGPGSQIPPEPEGLSGDPEPGAEAGEGASPDAGDGADGAVGCDVYNLTMTGDVAATLTASTCATGSGPAVFAGGFKEHQSAEARGIGFAEEIAPTLSAQKHDASVCYAIENHPADSHVNIDSSGKCQTLTNRMGTGGGNVPMVMEWKAFGIGNGQVNQGLDEELVGTLNCMHDPQAVMVPEVAHTLRAKGNCDFREDSETYVVSGVDCRNFAEYDELYPTLQAKPNGGQSLNYSGAVRSQHIVRRLSPLERERLQGYPDGWTMLPQIEDMTDEDYEFWKTVLKEREIREGRVRANEDGLLEIWRFEDGTDDEPGEWVNTRRPYRSKTKRQMTGWYNRMVAADSNRYKALGNSIALPQWKWLLKRLCGHYERDATMASLFDGIGGFPLIWEQLNGRGSCLWSSEIEEFPMAVTRARFGGGADEGGGGLSVSALRRGLQGRGV